MNTWSTYYKRTAFAEGVASAFDLMGTNSSYHDDSSKLSDEEYIHNELKMSFSDVAEYFWQAIEGYSTEDDE